jgi:hypothetical protein
MTPTSPKRHETVGWRTIRPLMATLPIFIPIAYASAQICMQPPIRVIA